MNTVSTQCHSSYKQGTERQTRTLISQLRSAQATLKEWLRRSRVRANLRAEMSEMDIVRVERDAGLPTGELQREANKPFWKS